MQYWGMTLSLNSRAKNGVVAPGLYMPWRPRKRRRLQILRSLLTHPRFTDRIYRQDSRQICKWGYSRTYTNLAPPFYNGQVFYVVPGDGSAFSLQQPPLKDDDEPRIQTSFFYSKPHPYRTSLVTVSVWFLLYWYILILLRIYMLHYSIGPYAHSHWSKTYVLSEYKT